MSTDIDDIENEDIEIKLEADIFTRLTDVVRNQYLKYLEKQLKENLQKWQEKQTTLPKEERESLETSIHECAKTLEDLAIREATITQLYQRAMLKTINKVRQNTKKCELMEQLGHIFILNVQKCNKPNSTDQATNTDNNKYSTKETQTESEPAKVLSLDERIDLFQKQVIIPTKSNAVIRLENFKTKSKKEQRKRRCDSHHEYYNKKKPSKSRHSTTGLLHSPTPSPPPQFKVSNTEIRKTVQNITENFEAELEGDEIAKELEKIFMEEDEDLEEIFGISLSYKRQSYNTVPSINSPKPLLQETDDINRTKEIVSKRNVLEKSPSGSTKSVANLSMTPVSSRQLYRQPITDLRYSIWPCECFMQKRRLSKILCRLVDEDIRWYDILRQQFSILFGDFGETDDFAICSPSLELDEVLRSSCVRRISPWVVTHLMKPLKDGLIGNRFLFKKLAKKLAHCIITENQYPDEILIKQTVENFFCIHRAVMTAEDLKDIDTMLINNSEE